MMVVVTCVLGDGETLLGVFPSLEEAEAAVEKARIEAPALWERFHEWMKRRDELLETPKPKKTRRSKGDTVIATFALNSGKPGDAHELIGPRPPKGLCFDSLYFHEMEPGRCYLDRQPELLKFIDRPMEEPRLDGFPDTPHRFTDG